MSGTASANRRRMRVAWGVLAAGLLVALFVKPILLFYLLGAVLWMVIVVFVYIQIGIQNTIAHTYRIPGTELVLRTTFDPWVIATAPYLEIRDGDRLPLKFCLAGPSLTRAQLYSVDSGGVLLETARDTYLIRVAPLSVEGPRSWKRLMFPENGVCNYDARGDAAIHERIAMKMGLKRVYLGAFVSGPDGYRRFLPASASPEQRIVPSLFAPMK